MAVVVLAQTPQWIASPTPTAEERAPGYARVSGRVFFGGSMPTIHRGRAYEDPACPSNTRPPHPFAIGNELALGDVLIRIRPAAGARHLPSLRDALLDEEVSLAWEQCRLSRRVIGLLAGQTLSLENRDLTLHNLRGTVGTALIFNRAVQPQSSDHIVPAATPGSVIQARCDVHPGEIAWIAIQQHPYFAVSGTDGRFEIDFVPDGAHVAEAFHPNLGWKTAGLGVTSGRASPLRFEFRARDATKH